MFTEKPRDKWKKKKKKEEKEKVWKDYGEVLIEDSVECKS